MNGIDSAASTLQRAGMPSTTQRLLHLPVASLCNAGQYWMAPTRQDGVALEAPLVSGDVEVPLANCLYATQPRGLPEPRQVALCLLDVATKTCGDSDDAWCVTALQRSADRMTARAATAFASGAAPGPAAVPEYRSLTELRQQVHPEFVGRTGYQDLINGLAISFADLTGLDLKRVAEPVTVDDLIQVLADSDSAEVIERKTTLEYFDYSIRDAGSQLGELLERIGKEVIDARPEVYAEALDRELEQWLPRHFPAVDAQSVTSKQRRHVMSLLVDYINEAIELRRAEMPMGTLQTD